VEFDEKVGNLLLVAGFKHGFYMFHIWDVIRNPLTNLTHIFQDR
jgi:hypothetical protein